MPATISYDQAYVRNSITPVSRTANATVNGVAVDTATKGGADSILAFVLCGTITDGTHTFSIEESADGSTGWAAIPAGRILGTAPAVVAADDDTYKEWGAITSARYVRVVVVTSGATSGGVFGAGVVVHGTRQQAH